MMTPEEKVAYINSQVACATIEMQAMLAENRDRESKGYTQAYGEDAFMNLMVEYSISGEAVVKMLKSTPRP
jgi:hypothetical protein